MQGKGQSDVENTFGFASRRNVFVSAGHYTYNPCKENYFYYLVCPVRGVVVVTGVCLPVSGLRGLSLVVPAFSLFLDLACGIYVDCR